MNTLEHPTLLKHPGPAGTERIISVPALSYGVLTRLPTGRTVLEHLTTTLQALGTDSGFAELYTGRLEPVSYCIPAAGDGIHRAVSFSGERREPEAGLVQASATIGLRFGEPFIHCHSYWETPAGPAGGHLWPDTVGAETAPIAAVYGIFGAVWTSADDPETNMPVFTPRATEEKNMPTPAALEQGIPTTIARILPNEDITAAVVRSCQEAGYRRAVVRGGLGSLVGAEFIDHASGTRRRVEGPGTEVVALTGHVDLADTDAQTRLSCTLVDVSGTIHAGELVPGMNPVAVTFELVLQRID